MHVIPDILPILRPSVDLRVVFPEAPPNNIILRARAKRKTVPIEAGVFLVNEQVNAKCRLSTKLALTGWRLDTPPAKTLHDGFPSRTTTVYIAYG